MIMAGVTVGKANLVCANSVVTKDTPDYAIVRDSLKALECTANFTFIRLLVHPQGL